MKKRIRLWFLILLATSIAGCSGDSTGQSGQSPNNNDDRPTIAFVTNQVASFWDIAAAGCKDAGRDLDVDVEVRFPSEATVTNQKQVVEDLMTSGIDALAISPLDAENQVAALNEWGQQIPLITHDSDAPGSERLMFIGVDNYDAGRKIGKMVKQAFPDGGEVIICIGRLQQNNAQLRRQGVIDELFDRSVDPERKMDPVEEAITEGKFTLLTTITDGGKESVALQKAEDAITAYPGLDCFVGLFVYNPVACLNAVKKMGKTDILIAGFDEADDTLQGIRDGAVIGTVSQNPYEYGYQSVKYLKDILGGNRDVIPDTKYVAVEAIVVTKENVDAFEADLKAKLGSR